MNNLYYGDCLTIMQSMGKDAVDLIYLDPPFNSNRAYNAIYKDETGRPLPDQIEAFCDLWTLDDETRRAIKEVPDLMRDQGIDDYVARFWQNWMNALRFTNSKLLAYLAYMTERLLQMKIILRPTGSIYLHCDPTCSHYLKVVMDGIFGHNNFRNEIAWCYKSTSQARRWYPKKHDILLFYTNGKTWTFNPDAVRVPFSNEKLGSHGGSWKGATEEELKQIHSRGKVVEDWWEIPMLNSMAKERLGYPTQKPLVLLERIIKASSNKGDIVFDPFCGCGTTLEAAQNLRRKWIGIDIAIHAIKRVSATRLNERCKLIEGQHYEITGIPRNLEGAEDLWRRDSYQFQKWAVEMINGFVTARKSHDGGVDGRLYFEVGDDLKAMKIEVKGGDNVRIADLRALAGIIDEEDYPMGGFITRKTLGTLQQQHFLDFCRDKGTVEIAGDAYPRLQILSAAEILAGKVFDTPDLRGKSTSLQTTFLSTIKP